MDIIAGKELSKPLKIAIVVSRFNEKVTQALLTGALERLQELEVDAESITVVWVPGAVEIPLVVKTLAHIKQPDAIVALGAVIRGQTSHYDYVCQQVSSGCQQVMLELNLPVIFGILTTENQAQAMDRVGGAHGHKGREAVEAAFEMVSVCRQLKSAKR